MSLAKEDPGGGCRRDRLRSRWSRNSAEHASERIVVNIEVRNAKYKSRKCNNTIVEKTQDYKDDFPNTGLINTLIGHYGGHADHALPLDCSLY